MWNYETYKEWLNGRLIEIKADLGFEDYIVEVFNERDFGKNQSLKAKTISVIIKFLSSTMIFSAKTQPIQILCITEKNSFSVANTILTRFCDTFNFAVLADGTTYVKHIYSTPTMLTGFPEVGAGYRAVFYVNATLFILKDVMDITDLKIDGVNIDAISQTIGYTMSGDTQPFDGGYAQTEKNFATFVMSLNVACIKNDFTEKVIKIMNKSSTDEGNENFAVSFKIQDFSFSFNMKLTGATLSTAKNSVPSLELGFSV